MNRAASIALLVVGLLLLGYGINASHSIGSDISRLFTGSPTDKTIWLMVSGLVAFVWGLVSLGRGSKS